MELKCLVQCLTWQIWKNLVHLVPDYRYLEVLVEHYTEGEYGEEIGATYHQALSASDAGLPLCHHLVVVELEVENEMTSLDRYTLTEYLDLQGFLVDLPKGHQLTLDVGKVPSSLGTIVHHHATRSLALAEE